MSPGLRQARCPSSVPEGIAGQSLGSEEIQSPAIENKGFNVWCQALAIDTKSLPFLISCFRD